MKKFLLSDVKESSQQAAYLFIAANVLWFVGGVAGLDYGNFGNLIQLFWSFSFAGIKSAKITKLTKTPTAITLVIAFKFFISSLNVSIFSFLFLLARRI